MGEMVASALAQEGVSRVSSFISTKLDDRASGSHNVARLEMALSRLEFVLEWARKRPITYVSLIRRWGMFSRAYNEGVDLLNKHKLPAALEGHAETGQVVVRSSYYYLQRIAGAAYFPFSSLAGLKRQCLSSSVVQIFEGYADSADKFVADVESACPLRRDTFFPYPFLRKLLEGKYLRYYRWVKGQLLWFDIYPVVWEGRGVEACLWYECFDPERLDKSFSLALMLRLSESTDIVGTAIDCVRSSASLLNLPAQEAIIGHLTQVRNLQEISDSYAPPSVSFEKTFASLSTVLRPDPLCCQPNGHGPSANYSLGLSHLFQEQTIHFSFSCYVSALEYNLPRASDEAGGRNIVVDLTPLKLDVGFTPHVDPICNSCVTEAIGSKREWFPLGTIEQTVDMTRSRSVEFLIRQPEVKDYRVYWISRHGTACFRMEKQRIAKAAVPKASGRYNTRSAAAKRKRS
ncbi:uncharacterized protein LOC120660876 [Panicum virgatum]|uniref:Uncharacterized protein n=1 Tax=Panicum virgatum TaxID=38727 RepID=A0A8T0W2T8_PANVG|nr:uncharacterized protein LOC120660876 [Panicum virgatum]XP_039795475.1 uncharacterized protein LOC120660876 [Panicum virgatum]XP_039795484.1 uncharacterized protein LOC120660876 [Panicum virgatum]KAG2639684.1 hypothetical protein PVAP13_2KG029300 [Panicum virgatum]